MPRRAFFNKSVKTICIDTILFFALFALVGHMTINFWERYTIQSELSTMKQSLHSLKDTIVNIGRAYDTLHVELKNIFRMVDKKEMKVLIPPCMHHKESEHTCKIKHTHRKLNDYHVQTAMTPPHKMKLTAKDEVVMHPNEFANSNDQYEELEPLSTQHASTNTKNPLISTGITSNLSDYEHEQYLIQRHLERAPFHHNLRCKKDTNLCKRTCTCAR